VLQNTATHHHHNQAWAAPPSSTTDFAASNHHGAIGSSQATSTKIKPQKVIMLNKANKKNVSDTQQQLIQQLNPRSQVSSNVPSGAQTSSSQQYNILQAHYPKSSSNRLVKNQDTITSPKTTEQLIEQLRHAKVNSQSN